ncbi:RdRP-domain-containing protein [Cylindrobasidium torrendii FP15055 ss-10]|uniref:RNA-dependent RNA polymerase n=1 Tax=Cylindrobasidium torrendii FP15055 ss-10 TaxID=1314674 RepID=A0A0D7BSW0_9AGAR|nr:RdRP-domain-containing protein [Cylindrobasidium torrendii FP15055 ss-10]
MEIAISNIPSESSFSQIHRALCTELHGRTDYTEKERINFHLQLYTAHGAYTGKGCLTLPTMSTGDRFLQEYGADGRSHVYVAGSCLKFARSTRRPDVTVCQRVSTEPYRDTTEFEDSELSDALLAQSEFELNKLQFGWIGFDDKFSLEWEYSCTPSVLTFCPDPRALEINIEASECFPKDSPDFEPTPYCCIIIPYSHINSLTSGVIKAGPIQDPVILINCQTPPSFFHGGIPRAKLPEQEEQVVRLRRAALGLRDSRTQRPHAEVAPFCSCAIRLVCSTISGPQKFRSALMNGGVNLQMNPSPWPLASIALRDRWSRNRVDDAFSFCHQFPFHSAFLFQSLLMNSVVSPSEMLQLRGKLTALVNESTMAGVRTRREEYMTIVIRDFENATRIRMGSVSATTRFDESRSRCLKFLVSPSSSPRLSREGAFMCLHVTVTPTKIRYDGPYPERSNRVIRSFPFEQYANFIRVTFTDEGGSHLGFSHFYDFPEWVYHRFGPFLFRNLRVANSLTHYLAYTQSSLRNHSLWFLRDFDVRQPGKDRRIEPSTLKVDVPSIISGLGQFDAELKRCPARYAARISMAFTITDPTATKVETLISIPDVERVNMGRRWNFTDGVGTMSAEFAKSIYETRIAESSSRYLRLEEYPRAVQIRFLGSKGVLSVDHTLKGKTVCLRPSMIKFKGVDSDTVEIAQVFDRPRRFCLNRPLVMVLEQLHVTYETFKEYQDAAIEQVRTSTQSIAETMSFLESHGLGSTFHVASIIGFLARHSNELSIIEDSFFQRAMDFARHDALRTIKHRARIPIPGAYQLPGVADVHGWLKEGQLFICVRESSGELLFLEGDILITKSPCGHPGDVQIARAIGRPPKASPFAKEPLANTVVFSINGIRPLASCLAGGDLDGDEYTVIPLNTNPKLRVKPYRPSAYPAAALNKLEQPCTQNDIGKFVLDYIISDNISQIATTWLILADSDGIFGPVCLKLSDLQSKAVDFPKSGTPVPVKDIPRKHHLKPDWSAPETMVKLDHRRYYTSQRAIGRLAREIELPATDDVVTVMREQLKNLLSERSGATPLERNGSHDIPRLTVIEKQLGGIPPQLNLEELVPTFLFYRTRLHTICRLYSISAGRESMLTEEEIFIGTIVANTPQPGKRKANISRMREACTFLANHVREALHGQDLAKCLSRAYAVWQRCTQSFLFGARTFAWIALGVCVDTMTAMEEEKQQGVSIIAKE